MIEPKHFNVPILLLALSSLVSCNNSNSNITSTSDAQLKQVIASRGLTGNPITTNTPSISSKEAQLGMELFYSKSLGGDRDSACVTCHHPTLGGGDNLTLPIGTEAETPDLLGPGRVQLQSGTNYDAGPTVPRNAPTTFNLAAWKKALFHDGRVESLGASGIRTPDSAFGTVDAKGGENLAQAQARFPVTSPEEMKAFNNNDKDNQQMRDFLAQRLGGYGAGAGVLQDTDFWLNKFRTVFNSPSGSASELITEQNISFLIGEFERSQVFVDTPWKSYVDGDTTAISEDAKKGALLFFSTKEDGGANCSSCHSGDFFTDEAYHNLAMPQIGRGKGDGNDGSNDFGRFRETKQESDKFAFRTPTLTNVEVTGPWTHAGSYTSLSNVIKHHLDPQSAIDNYDINQLTQQGIQTGNMQANTQLAIDSANFESIDTTLTDTQVGYLVTFLKTLTDPCVKDRQCLSSWILDPEVNNDPNGDQLNAVDINNTTL